MTNSGASRNLSPETTVVKIHPPKQQEGEWKQEAEQQGTSLSRYLQALILEARAYRDQGLINTESDQRRIQELEEEIERLEQRVSEKESESSTAVSFDPATLKQEFLTGNYQSLEDILRAIVESGELNEVLRQPVENQLYFLAARDEVEYERGWGWKLSEDNGGEQ